MGWDIEAIGFEPLPLRDLDKSEDVEAKYLGEKYEVIISCNNENEQSALLLRLSNEGLKVKAIVI